MESSVNAQVRPSMLKINERHSPFFLLDVRVTLEQEPVDAIRVAKVIFVELANVVIGDFNYYYQEGRKNGILVVKTSHNGRLCRDEWHIRDGGRLR